MHLHCLGINHHTADIAVREKLAFTPQTIQAYWDRLTNNSPNTELVILSTCNRVEIYVYASRAIWTELESLVAESVQITTDQIQSHLYRLVDEQVVSHLFRVSAGLDSMVLGEPQILGQITNAYEQALTQGSAGKVVSKLFQSAIFTGKRVRTETAISKNSTSVSSLAANMAQKIVPDLTEAKITLLGAGEMAELAVEALQKRGVNKFHVLSRTIASACTLAERWEGNAGTMENLNGVLEDTDILITSTSAPHTLIHKNMVKQIMRSRPDRPLVMIDIAVPRDVAANVQELENVEVYDIDRLNNEVAESLDKRSNEIPKVEQILEEEYKIFKKFWNSLKVVPVIKGMRERADTIRQQELEKVFKHLPNLNEAEQAEISAMTQSIIQKFLHAPTIKLREEADGPEAEKYAHAASRLFGLDGFGD